MSRPKLDPRLLDDIARVAGGAVNIVSGLRQQLREDVRSRMDSMADYADLVPRADMERAEAMIQKLRARIDELEARMDAWEGTKPAAKAVKKTAAKTGPKKPAAKGKKK